MLGMGLGSFDSAESAHDYYCKFKVSFQALL
jgi:hypothetical protein